MLLNWDTLTEVMAWLNRPRAARMSRTCRALRAAAPRMLLKDKVEILYAERFTSLCLFMFADRQRFRFLRKLSLQFFVEDEDSELGMLIADFFSHSTELEWLHLDDCLLLEVYEPVLSSMSSLTKLRTLQLENLTDHTEDLIKNIQLPLTKINIDFSGSEDFFDPISVLSPFKHSLKAVSVDHVNLFTLGVQYPLVTTLHVGYCDGAELEVLEHSFPNLRKLSFEIAQEEGSWTSEEVEVERHSSLSLGAQDSWTSLARLTGNILSLYILGVRCRVEHLDVTPLPMKRPEHCQRLTTMLTDFRPPNLELALDVAKVDLSQLPGILSPIEESLLKLRLCLKMRGHRYEDPTAKLVS